MTDTAAETRISVNDVLAQRIPDNATGIAWGGDPSDPATQTECIDCLLDPSWWTDRSDEPEGTVLHEPVRWCDIHDRNREEAEREAEDDAEGQA